MGCSCVHLRKTDAQTEIKDGVLPYSELNNLENLTSTQSEKITLDQQRNDKIFDFFNDLRNFPQKYIEESRKYGLSDIISSSEKRRKSEKINNLIKNQYFNLIFDKNVRKSPYSKEEILKNLEIYEKTQKYKKYLYSSKSSIENPKECIWNLLKENKDIALNEILFNKIDYFLVSTLPLPDNKTIITYFCFLIKSNK